jgi:hypothetical protein
MKYLQGSSLIAGSACFWGAMQALYGRRSLKNKAKWSFGEVGLIHVAKMVRTDI